MLDLFHQFVKSLFWMVRTHENRLYTTSFRAYSSWTWIDDAFEHCVPEALDSGPSRSRL